MLLLLINLVFKQEQGTEIEPFGGEDYFSPQSIQNISLLFTHYLLVLTYI